MFETTERGNYSLGIFGSIKRLADTGLAIVQNRIELLAVELREEKERVAGLLIWGGALVFMAFQALTALMLTLVVVFRDQALYIFGGFALFYFLGAVAAFFLLRSKIKMPPFAETIAQLKKDRRSLRNR